MGPCGGPPPLVMAEHINDPRQTEIQYVKGVGPRLATLFGKLGIHTAYELAMHFPRRYEDRRNLPKLKSLRPGMQVTVRGRISHVESKVGRSRMVRVIAVLNDGTGQVTLTWFNQPWLAKKLRDSDGEVIAFGTIREGQWGYEMASPDYEIIDEDAEPSDFGAIVPVYASTENLNQKVLRKAARAALEMTLPTLQDPMPSQVVHEAGLEPYAWSLQRIHRPETEEEMNRARARFVFDELFTIQLLVQLKRVKTQQEPGIVFPISRIVGRGQTTGLFTEGEIDPGEATLWDQAEAFLPFRLTGAQRLVIGQIWEDMERPTPMNRLLQGDVGSGKTAVAACAMLAAVRCGYQAALMAPTEILAEQHAMNLRRLFEPTGIEVVFLAGKLNAKTTAKTREAVASGRAHIVVGTHALIQEGVKFAQLGLAVIDEQHRFGVMQRVALRQKSDRVPDVLVMTATPIPRTLAMTVYGDLDVSVIDELPPGRKPIKTHWKRPSDRPKVYENVRALVQQGRQAYFVCPAIEESEKLQVQAAVDLHYRLSEQVFPEFKVGLLHGQLKPAEKESVMEAFRQGELHILVATVVIEVGVDVPNASVMVVEDANRFGLSQLHQIRGRVGRGEHQSFCILIADASSDDARERMEVLVETQDGFVIAEADLRIRGPGSLVGTEQSGVVDLRVADLIRDQIILEKARSFAARIAESDPHLQKPEHALLAAKFTERASDQAWIIVS